MAILKAVMIHDQIYLCLRKALMCGHFKPGEQLSARGLATELEVSQMPVRDALNRLTSESALERTKDRRYRVPLLDETYIKNLYEARLTNEGRAAELAASRMTKNDLIKLIDVQDRIEKEAKLKLELRGKPDDEVDVRNDVNLHNEFHFTIYRSCENPVLVSIIEMLWLQYAPGISIYIENFTTSLSKTALEKQNRMHNKRHRKIIAALKSKNPVTTKEVLMDDITSYKDILESSNSEQANILSTRHISEYIV
ncbi:MAG: hypothetical protein DRQ47_00230 [Gammaproteobacteria bacterium]|nr:MAG: hypothetical protein DRQ47_00230 [Gammaproteobacteria bacterium]